MGKRQKSRMLVTDENGRLVGVISLSDITQVEEASRATETMRQVTDRDARQLGRLAPTEVHDARSL